MRIIICGDTHIGAVFGLGKSNGRGGNTRVDDYEATLNHIVDYTISTGADVFVQAGDVFDVRNPEAEHVAIVTRCIRKLSDAGVTSVWIMGNHDYKRFGESYTSAITSLSAGDHPNTRIILRPEILEIVSETKEKASIVLMPFRDRRMYAGQTTEQDSLLYEQEVKSLIRACDQEHPIIAVGHNFFFEGSYSHYGGAEVLINVNTFSKCDMVAMGHHHSFRVFKKKDPIAFYTGSMERLNFGDADADKFFIDYDTNRKKVSVKKVPSRKLIDSYINVADADFNNLHSKIQEEVGKLKVEDAVVRVKLAVKDTLASSIKKPDVQRALYDNGAFYISKVLIDPIHKRLNRDLEILNEKTDISMFKAFLKKQDLSDEMKEGILKEAEKVIK
nr:nuclease SbcCD subunit D [bacterium]